MLRKLLTLFALLTGLAAAGAPAQAHAVGLQDVRLEASSGLAAQCTASRVASASHFAQLTLSAPQAAKVCPRPTATVIIRIPSVMLGIDRARE